MKALQWALATVGLLSIALIAIWLIGVPRNEWPNLPIPALGAVVAASIASIAALAVSETIDQRRQRQIESSLREHREEVYEELLKHLVRAFAATAKDPDAEVRVRATIAAWGSHDVIRSLARWHHLTGLFGVNGGHVPPERRSEVQELLGQIAVNVREDLNHPTVIRMGPRPEEIAAMIFNDYELPAGKS